MALFVVRCGLVGRIVSLRGGEWGRFEVIFAKALLSVTLRQLPGIHKPKM